MMQVKNIRRLFLNILLLNSVFFCHLGLAQNYPIGINLNIQAPHSPAYHTLTNDNFLQTNKINLSLFLKDLVTISVDVGLQWEFRGPTGIYLSDPNLVRLPINIQQGIPTLLSNNELTIYLQSNNLPEVITNEDGFMAEGNWELCVTAFELLNGEQVSATTCYYLFLEEYDPPEIIMPLDSMMPIYPQNVQMAWQPLHIGNFPVQYEVNVWEVIPGMTDQQIVQSTFPYYSAKVDQLTSTFLTMADPPLDVGQDYLIRVQISDKVNGEGGLPVYQFKNYGYSDVVRFKYGMFQEGEDCSTPSLPEYVLDDSLRSYILWDDGHPPIYQYEQEDDETSGGGGGSSSGGALYHRMYYRPVNDESSDWKSVDTEEQWARFSDYRRGQSYEVYVSNVCSAEERASESIVVDFPMLPPERDFLCGIPPLDVDMENREPLPIMMLGDTFMAGDFRVVVEEVSGGNGYFSGEGYFRSKFLKTVRVAVEFDDIYINSEYRMVEGYLETKYDPLDGIMFDIDEVLAGFEGNDEPFPVVHVGQLDEVKFENGMAILYPGGEEYEAPLRVVTPDGEYLLTGGMMLEKDEDFEPPNKINEDYEVAFQPPGEMIYGYDAVDMNYADHYGEVGGKKIPHKSVAYGGVDALEMTIVKSKEVWKESDWDSISIRTHSQFEVKWEIEPGNKLTIKVPGLEEAEHIYVMYGKKCIGAFHLNSYMFTEFQVNLIPVNGVGRELNISELEKEINKILGQGVAGVKLNLKTSQNITDGTQEIEADKYLMTAYSADMRRILNKHKDTYGQEDNELYLFLVNNLEGDVAGYMADGLNAGFIEVGGDVAHTIAHELGHGAFTLVHSWDEYDKDTEGTSDNLMDYSGGDRLRVKQWNRMHDQKLPRPWVRGSEEQQYASIKMGELFEPYVREGGLSFLSNMGFTITLPADSITNLVFATGGEQYVDSEKYLPIGTLAFFKVKDKEGNEVEYANYGDGYYYKYPKQETLERYSQPEKEIILPIALRPTYLNGKLATHIIAIPDYKRLYDGEQKSYDFLLEEFYYTQIDIVPKGEIKVVEDITGLNLGEEFLNPLYLEIINAHPEFIESNRLSNFYLNGLAYFVNKYSSYFNSCDVNTDLRKSLVDILAILDNAVMAKEQNIYINSSPPMPESPFEKDLKYLLNYFETEPGIEEETVNVFDLIYLISSREEMLKTYQKQIDQYSESSIEEIKKMMKEVSSRLLPCEFAQLDIPYELAKELIGFIVFEDAFWVTNKEEEIVLNLISSIKEENYDDFLNYISETSYVYTEIDQSQYSVSYDPKKTFLWAKMVDRIDNSMLDANGKRLFKAMHQMWFTSESGKQKSERFINGIEEEIAKIELASKLGSWEMFQDINSKIVPFHYTNFLKRINWLCFMTRCYVDPFPEVPITDTKLNDDGSFDVLSNNKTIFFVNGTNDHGTNLHLDPFEPVIIDLNTKFGVAKELLSESDIKVFPAFALYYLDVTASRNTQADLIFTALDVASFAIPVTKLTWFHKALMYADRGSSILSMAGTYSQEDPQVSRILNTTSLLLGVTDFFGQGVQSMIKNSDKIKARKQLFQHLETSQVETYLDPVVRKATLEQLLNGIDASGIDDINKLANADRTLIKDLIRHEVNDIENFGSAVDQAWVARILAKLDLEIPNLSTNAIDLSNQGIKNIVEATVASGSKFEASAGRTYQDIIIHSDGSRFYIDGVEKSIDELADMITVSDDELRLLSCNDIPLGKELSSALGRSIVVNDGYTRIHADGLVSIVPRAGPEARWYRLNPDGTDEVLEGIIESTSKYADDFVELSSIPKASGLLAKCPPDLLKNFETLGLTIDRVKSLFIKLSDDLPSVQKLYDILDANKGMNAFPDLVDDLLSDGGEALLKRLGEVGVDEGSGYLMGWSAAGNLPDEIKLNPDDLEVLTHIINTTKRSVDDLAEEIPTDLQSARTWIDKFKNLDVASFDDFAILTYTQKLMHLHIAWQAYYPQIFFERRLFEDFMGKYRYIKPGFGHTNDIATNFEAIDFFGDFTKIGNSYYAKTGISMKTTTTTDVNKWLASEPVKKNINKLRTNRGPENGITSKGETVFYEEAEIHIYMPKEKFSDQIKYEWLIELNKKHSDIKFDIKVLEDYIEF